MGAYAISEAWFGETQPAGIVEVRNLVSSKGEILQGLSPRSNDLLAYLREDLRQIGFEVEEDGAGTARELVSPADRAALFTIKPDAIRVSDGVQIEVERGGVQTNSIYRNIIHACMLDDVEYLVIVLPRTYRVAQTKRGLRYETQRKTFDQARRLVEALHGSSRLRLPLKGVLLIGY